MRKSVLRDADLAMNDVYPLIRDRVLRYGNKVYALSLGEPPLLLAGPSAESIQLVGAWEQLDFRLSSKGSTVTYPHVVELLARAIAYSQHRSRSAICFDVESMQPLLTTPPFVKALQQMCSEQLAKDSPAASLALVFPSTEGSTTIAELPNAQQVYNLPRNTWEKNKAAEGVTLLGFAGRSMSVTRSTRNSSSAFRLLAWLGSEATSTQLSPRSQATAWFRKSQLASAQKWLAEDTGRDAASTLVTKLLASEQSFLLPRIPGIDEYLKKLDEAVSSALEDSPVSGQTQSEFAEQTLQQATSHWNAITDHYGRDRQRVAYRRHLGLDDSDE